MEVENYPGNSHKSRNVEPKPEPKKVEKVIKGSVVTRKKTFSRRIIDTFFGEDVESVSSYIIYEVLIPAVKDTVYDMIKGGTEMLLFPGEPRTASRQRRGGGRSYVHYDRVSYRDDRRGSSRDTSARNRARHNFEDIILETSSDAEDVRDHLIDLIEEYGIATVADLYELTGVEISHTDRKWGWDNLAHSRIIRAHGGWLIDLPKPMWLD